MYELLLLRHAEAEPAALDGGDFERPLTPAGRAAALAAGARLAALPWQPQRLLYSPAARASTTAMLIAQALGLDAHALHEVPELYLATPPVLRGVAQARRGTVDRLMIVGHNPGLSEWGGQLAARHADQSLPTAGFWRIESSERHWQQLLGA
jgi:phosphohistidine phosphatase